MWNKVMILAAATLLLTATATQADVLNMGGTRTGNVWTGNASIELVFVDNAGNTGESIGITWPYTIGGVAYDYYIDKYEVTNAQYTEFLNAKAAAADPTGLYNTLMGSAAPGGITRTGSGPYSYSTRAGRENWPVNYVSWWDGARFANWLNNGQGAGNTEDGTYDLTLALGSIVRKPGATYFLTRVNEEYKAMNYDPDKGGPGGGGWWDYPNGSDTIPTKKTVALQDAVAPGSANYASAVGSPTPVGSYNSYPTVSKYGTYDQTGNVWDWTENGESNSRARDWLGGGWSTISGQTAFLHGIPYQSGLDNTNLEDPAIGFRIASTIPEPGSLAMLAGMALLGSLYYWRKRA